MNAPQTAVARRRQDMERLQRLFESLERAEPLLVEAARRLAANHLAALLPKASACALMAGDRRTIIKMRMEFDFTEGRPAVRMSSMATTPALATSSTLRAK